MKRVDELIGDIVDGLKKQVTNAVICGDDHAIYTHHVGAAVIEVYTDADDNVIVELNKPNRNDCDNVLDAIADAIPSWESMKWAAIMQHGTRHTMTSILPMLLCGTTIFKQRSARFFSWTFGQICKRGYALMVS